MKKRAPNLSMKKLREILGKSQCQFAEMLGVSTDTVGSIEIGRVNLTPKMNDRIRRATGASLTQRSWIFGSKSKPGRPGHAMIKNGEVRSCYSKFPTYNKEAFLFHVGRFAVTEDDIESACENLRAFVREAKTKSRSMVLLAFDEWIEQQRAAFKLPSRQNH